YVVGWSDGGINSILLALRHPEKVKKMAITGANLVPDTTAVPKEVWNLVKPGYFMVKNKKNKSYEDSMQLKLLRLLIEQPHISPAELQQIKAPTLVIGGDNDVIKPEHTLLIWKNIPGASLWILPNSGHSTPLVYKDDFNRIVDQFFQTKPRTFTPNDRFF
nr:alpha/beta hydrolase [Chitinophagaceae bacterium]